jgi:hypothetical protein
MAGGTSDLNIGINEEIAAHLREQAKAHTAIAETLMKRPNRPVAVKRAQVHIETAARYYLLAHAVDGGLIARLYGQARAAAGRAAVAADAPQPMAVTR